MRDLQICPECGDPDCTGVCPAFPGAVFGMCRGCRKSVMPAGSAEPCLVCKLEADLARVTAERDRLRLALQVYADRLNWGPVHYFGRQCLSKPMKGWQTAEDALAGEMTP